MAAEAGSSSSSGCTLTRGELLGGTSLKAREWRFINPERWDDDVQAPNDDVDAVAATT